MKWIYTNNYLFEIITSSNISFSPNNQGCTQSGFSDFVDFVRITKTSQDNHYVNPFVLLMPLSLPLKTSENLKVYLTFSGGRERVHLE